MSSPSEVKITLVEAAAQLREALAVPVQIQILEPKTRVGYHLPATLEAMLLGRTRRLRSTTLGPIMEVGPKVTAQT